LPYVGALAGRGFADAVRDDPALAKGVNVYAGAVTNAAVAEAHGLSYRSLDQALDR
jgi:alanine dehydrogenase